MEKISVVLPCLNEEQSIAFCLDEALKALGAGGLSGEIIVVDNGSTDASASIIQRCIDAAVVPGIDIRLIHQPKRGYGSAYRTGFSSAQHSVIFMADADGTYDFMDVARFVQKINEGSDIVIGDRFATHFESGVMPWHRQHIGNPVLSYLVRAIYRTPVQDVHCGARAFRKSALEKLHLTSDGMELASEMIIKATKEKLRISELPISYKARIGSSKLRSFRDGLRHLRCIVANL